MSTLTTSQQAALAATGNVLVMAGAGTGKTRTLVERCCAWLESGGTLDAMLMVTFTDAAAAEMRHRIRARLESRRTELAAAGSPGAVHLEEQLALLDSADISTIHSFCLKLIRENFHHPLLQLDPELTVLTEAQLHQLRHETFDPLLESRYEADSDDARAFRELLATRFQGNEARLRELIWRLHRYTQSLADPAGWLAQQSSYFASTEPTQWQRWLNEAFAECCLRWRERFEPFAFAPNIQHCLAALNRLSAEPTAEEVAEALAIVAATYDAEWPRGQAGTVRDPLEECFTEARFLHTLADRTETSDPLAQDWEWTRRHMLTLLELTTEFGDTFARTKRDWGGVDFADLEQFALRLLWNPATQSPTEIARRWQQRLTHVFVDEYQDINAAQDTILRALSRAGAAANRFLVGDVKQSIYRFRLADPTIFQNYKRAWESDPLSGQTIPLAENFRSREALLDFINPLFRELMREGVGGVSYDDAAELKFGAPDHRVELKRQPDRPPAVELQLLLKTAPEGQADPEPESDTAAEFAALDATEKEARRVAQRLHELRREKFQVWDETGFRDVTWRDMVILLRSPAGKIESFAKEFQRAGIPLQAARGGFYDTTEISDLLSLLQLLDNPLQDIPLLAVLRSPLVGLSLDELAVGHAAFPREQLWTALSCCGVKQPRLEPAARAILDAAQPRLQAFQEQFGRWRNLARTGALSDCLETILTETHYEAMMLASPRGEERRANVRRLLELIRQFDPYQRQGLMRFLQFVTIQRDAEAEEPAATPTTTDAVRLMSIHKSKGLEFPVVVLPDLAKTFNLQDLAADVLLDARLGLCPRVTPPQRNGSYPSLPHWLARRQQRRDTLGEELRLLYVALTRARDHLLLIATTSPKAVDSWRDLEPAAALATTEILGARNYLDWLLLWLKRHAGPETWRDARSGSTTLVQWQIQAGAETPTPVPQPETTPAAKTSPALPREALDRLAWQYPLAPATITSAKTSVTALRRQADETDDEAEKRYPPVVAATPSVAGKLSAAEVGLAHHAFQQWVDLAAAASLAGLRQEAERLQSAGKLSGEQIAALDFEALAGFWQSELGVAIRAHVADVLRELEFTARFSPVELAQLTHTPPPGLTAVEDFVVVQGVADLVVLRPDEIWLLDFKTDHVAVADLPAKVAHYTPQLQFYALALTRIYRRPVSRCWLHFLSARTTISVEPPA